MKKILGCLILLSAFACAQQTPNLHLNIPAPGTPGWGLLLNTNFNVIDSLIPTPPATAYCFVSTGVLPQNWGWQICPGGISGANTGAGSGLQGGGVTGTLNLSLLTTCAINQVLQWTGSAWVCASPGTGTVTGVAPATGGGLTGGGSGGNVLLGLITSCGANQVLQWSGSAWLCSTVGVGTITGIVAGTDLTGGGSSGSVGVALANPIHSNTTGTANTANSLSGAPSQCPAGQAAAGIISSGNASGCFTPAGTAPPAGSGFPHITTGAQDPTARSVNLASGDVTGSLPYSQLSGVPTSLPPSGSASGDLSGSYPSPNVSKINGTALSVLATGILKNTNGTGTPSIAVAGDFPALNQNTTGTAANLSGTPALPNGTTATTQGVGDSTTKLATDAFVLANAGVGNTTSSGLSSGVMPRATASTTLGPSGWTDDGAGHTTYGGTTVTLPQMTLNGTGWPTATPLGGSAVPMDLGGGSGVNASDICHAGATCQNVAASGGQLDISVVPDLSSVYVPNSALGQPNGVPQLNSSGFVIQPVVDGITNLHVQNCTTTGTTQNKLVSLISGGAGGGGALFCATTTPAASTSGVIGLCVSGCGNSGTATIQQVGQATCVVDGSIAAQFNYLKVSSSVAGDCSDAGSTYPTSGQVIGFATGTALPVFVNLSLASEAHGFTSAIIPNSTTLTNAYFATAVAGTLTARNIGTSDVSPFWFGTDATHTNSYVLTLAPAMTALTPGTTVKGIMTNSNTSGNVHLNVNATGNAVVTKCGAVSLAIGDIAAGAEQYYEYDGTQYELLNPQAAPCRNTLTNNVLSSGGGTGQPSKDSDLQDVSSLINSAVNANQTITVAGGQDSNTNTQLGSLVLRGANQTGTGGAASGGGNVNVLGGGNTATNILSQGGGVELTPGASTGATQGLQGLLIENTVYAKGTTVTQWNLECYGAAAQTVTDCGASPSSFIGVAEVVNTNTVQVAVAGQIFINASAAVTLGDTVCAGSTAGKVTDSGGTAGCAPGSTVGIVVATSKNWVLPDGTSVTATTTLPLIQLGAHPATSSMVYPGAGVPQSTGSAWGTSYAAPTGSLVGTGQSNTWTTGTQDFSAVTLFKLRFGAGLTTSANGDIGYDTTNNNWHAWQNGVDSYQFGGPVSGTYSNGDCVKFGVVSSVITLVDTGLPCGGGGSGAGSSGSTGVGIVLSGTSFSPLYGQYSSIITTNANAQLAFATANAVSNLQVVLGTATSASQTVAVTLLDNGSATAVTCTVAISSTTCSDTTHSVSPVAGHLLSWQMVLNTGTLTTNVAIGAQIGNAAGSYTGNTTKAVSGTGSYTSGHGTKVDANANVIDSGAAYADSTSTNTFSNKTLVGANLANNVILACPPQGTLSLITGTAATINFYSCSIPANVLVTNTCIRAHAAWKHTGTVSVAFNWLFGGTSIGSYSSANNGALPFEDVLTICQTGANAQSYTQGPSFSAVTPTAASHTSGTTAVTTTSTQTLSIQFNVAATDSVTPLLWYVEMLQ
jgi:fibronectin-binding autotransporter adhesin